MIPELSYEKSPWLPGWRDVTRLIYLDGPTRLILPTEVDVHAQVLEVDGGWQVTLFKAPPKGIPLGEFLELKQGIRSHRAKAMLLAEVWVEGHLESIADTPEVAISGGRRYMVIWDGYYSDESDETPTLFHDLREHWGTELGEDDYSAISRLKLAESYTVNFGDHGHPGEDCIVHFVRVNADYPKE